MVHISLGISKRILAILLVGIALTLLWSSRPMAGDTDEEIQDTILRQIEAFANNDQEQAWAYASEGIKRRFGSSQVFTDMVREAYPAVHSAKSIEFARRIPHGSFEIQVVKLRGPEGKRWEAYYRMVMMEGTWKIAGVRLEPADIGI
ncbi:MAG: DUF4864 domain-containing protein [Marinobacter sp.]|uniref:DUF4864 domain-containing protein n=1 Tax=Marinobacter sp. TaxID=50741 RepID=UPI0032992393